VGSNRNIYNKNYGNSLPETKTEKELEKSVNQTKLETNTPKPRNPDAEEKLKFTCFYSTHIKLVRSVE
jgi:hypothetical protein